MFNWGVTNPNKEMHIWRSVLPTSIILRAAYENRVTNSQKIVPIYFSPSVSKQQRVKSKSVYASMKIGKHRTADMKTEPRYIGSPGICFHKGFKLNSSLLYRTQNSCSKVSSLLKRLKRKPCSLSCDWLPHRIKLCIQFFVRPVPCRHFK